MEPFIQQNMYWKYLSYKNQFEKLKINLFFHFDDSCVYSLIRFFFSVDAI